MPAPARSAKSRTPARRPTGLSTGPKWQRDGWWLALAASGWLVVLLVVLAAPVPLRVVAVFGFATVGPGLPLAGLLKRCAPLERLALAVGVSVSLTTLLAEAMSLSGMWSPTLGMVALAVVCSAGVSLRLVRDVRCWPPEGPPLPSTPRAARS